LFADLIVLPILLAYRKYYGGAFAVRITALMFATIVIAALIVDTLFGGLGLIPHARPTRSQIFGEVAVNYKLVLNAVALVAFVVLMSLTVRRDAGRRLPGTKRNRHDAHQTTPRTLSPG
jgi:hypothetical protein